MKKLLFTIFVIIISSVTINAQQEIMTNKSVIDMLEIGFTEDVIITKINTSQCNFNTVIEELKILKEKGVSSNIIVAMMKSTKENRDNADISNNSVSGIFIKEGKKMIRIHPSVFSGTKINTLGAALSYGLADSKIKSTMSGSTSNNIVNTNLPIFYFLFDHNRNNTSLSNWWFSVATSPNQFALVELIVNGKKRELETGKVNIYSGTSTGVNEEYTIKFRIEEINEFEYRVIPEEPLVPGAEYCFFYKGNIPQGGYNNQSVFDFSIPVDCKIGISTLGEIDDIQCRVVEKYSNGIKVCTSQELTVEQMRKSIKLFSIKDGVMFLTEDEKGKTHPYAGIDKDYIILYGSKEFIKR